MIIHSPIISGSLTFADGATVTYPEGGVYSGSFSGSYQGDSFTGGIFIGDGSSLTFGGTNIVSSSLQTVSNLGGSGVISSSIQISSLGANIVSSSQQTISNLGGSDIVSSSVQTANRLSNQATDFGTGRVSGDNIGSIDGSTTFTGSFVGDGTNLSGVTSYTDADTLAYINSRQVVSSSAQISSYGVFAELNGDGLISGSSQVDHDATTNFVSNEHIDHSSVTLTAGNGLTGGGDITTNRTFNVGQGDGISVTADAIAVDNTVLRTTGDGIISSSAQIDHDLTTNFVAGEHFLQSAITQVGTVTQGSVTAILPNGTVSGSSQVVLEDADKTGFTGASSITTLGNVTSGDVSAILPGNSISSSIQVDHDATTNFVSNEHIDHSTVSVTAGSGLTGGGTIAATRTINVGQGDGISVSADAIGVDNTVARTNANNSFSGEQTFQDIVVNGTGSFAYIQQVTGSAKIIGDNYIILNADSPSERYAGLKVYDSGSSDTGSLEYDSVNNHWFYESTTEGYASGLISGPRDSRGAITWPTNNTLVKGIGGNHIDDSNITDTGTLITLGSNVQVNGNIAVTGTVDGRDVSSDGTKLDGIESNAKDDQTITAGDGLTGGGTGDVTLNVGAGTGVTVTADAVSIGQAVGTGDDVTFGTVRVDDETASTSKTTGALIVDGGVGIGLDLNVGGDVVAYASSDERLKDNIELISNPIEKVQSLRGVTWEWNENASETQKSTPNVGVIAQEVEKVLPQLVHDRENGYKGVDYAKLTGLLIEAIKDQQKQIDDLKSKLG